MTISIALPLIYSLLALGNIHSVFAIGENNDVSTSELRQSTDLPTSISSTAATSTASLCTAANVPMKTISFMYDSTREVMATSGSHAGLMVSAAPDGIMYNVCRGINAVTGGWTNNITLTAADRNTRDKNRRKYCSTSKGKPMCADIKAHPNDFIVSGMPQSAKDAINHGIDMSCHEFPFARTVEAGIPDAPAGTSMCIPRVDNGWQGALLSKHFCNDPSGCGDDKIHDWCSFVVEVVGWDCVMQQPAMQRAKRDFGVREDQLVGENLYHNFDIDTPGLNLLSLPLGGLQSGLQLIDFQNYSGVFNTSVVSYDGFEYPQTSSNTTYETQLFLSDDTEDLSLAASTFDTNVNVSFSIRRADGAGVNAASDMRSGLLSAQTLMLSMCLALTYIFV